MAAVGTSGKEGGEFNLHSPAVLDNEGDRIKPKIYSKIKLSRFWIHCAFTVSWKSLLFPTLTMLLSLVS